jgi:hypothetical protein
MLGRPLRGYVDQKLEASEVGAQASILVTIVASTTTWVAVVAGLLSAPPAHACEHSKCCVHHGCDQGSHVSGPWRPPTPTWQWVDGCGLAIVLNMISPTTRGA